MNSSKNNSLVLAYSGGLDTSYCIKYLSLKGWAVHAVAINTGGFDAAELQRMEENSTILGAASFRCINAVENYYDQYLRYLVYGNVLRNQTYPLSVSAERMCQAVEIAKAARETGAQAIAHGSTGAGNDQVRFDLAFQVLCPEMEIITPIRDQQLARATEVAFLEEHGFCWSEEKAKYSINKGVWGTSIGGAETLTSHQTLPESAWPTQLSANEPSSISLTFTKGELYGVNDRSFDHPLAAIEYLSELAAPYAIGRDVHVGDTIIGIKGRVGFEAAAPLIIIKAHHLLEKHLLGKWQAHWKEQLGNWYGMMLHEGLYLDDVMRNIENFLEDTQQNVSGKVFLKLHPYRFELIGVEAEHDRMQIQGGQYGEMNEGWSGEDVKGFTKILANHFAHQQKPQPV
ncbi:argininosuccinate synthase [Lewinellaceae bacterium SD302]|nr:argininosuccinate synthase [Lewinellaceae bacterium SD302]